MLAAGEGLVGGGESSEGQKLVATGAVPASTSGTKLAEIVILSFD